MKLAVTREEFFFSSAFGAVALPHLSLNPRGETHFLHFQQDSVGARDTDEEGEKVREKTLVLKGIAIFRARKLLQKVTPHKLLSNRRAALGKTGARSAALSPFEPAARAIKA